MKRVTLLCGLLLALSATVAAAAPGVGLRWNECIGDAGAINRNFTCAQNNGAGQLVGTFVLGANLNSTSGNEIVIDLGSASPALPSWWGFKNPGTCRTGSLIMGTAPTLNASACFDWAGGLATGGIGAYIIGARGPNTSRIVSAIAVPPTGLRNLIAGREYFSFTFTINNANTVGDGACEGCSVPVCIVFNSINLTTPVLENNVKLSGPSNGTDADFATWQGGAGVVVGGTPGCGAATPTRNTTWGAVKSLYR